MLSKITLRLCQRHGTALNIPSLIDANAEPLSSANFASLDVPFEAFSRHFIVQNASSAEYEAKINEHCRHVTGV
jgi:hypothetical protein